jgi:hypothetical protein
MPRGRAWSGRIEHGVPACSGRNPPAGQGAGKRAGAMPGEDQAGGAACLCGKPETPGEERRLDLDLAKGGGEGLGLQALFQGPGGVDSGACLDDEEECGIETEGEQPRPIRRSPFARPSFRQAPEQRRGGSLSPRHVIAKTSQSEGKRGRLIAIGGRSDLMQPCRGEPAPGHFPLFVMPAKAGIQ